MSSLSVDELAALQDEVVRIAILFRLESDPITRLWQGIGDFDIGADPVFDETGASYQGAGELVGVPEFEQLVNGKAQNASFVLSGVTQDIINIAMNGAAGLEGKRVYLGDCLLNERWQQITQARWLGVWFVDYLTIAQDVQTDLSSPIIRSVSLNCSTVFSGRRRAPYSFFTPQDQQARSPNDNFCRFVPSLQTKTVKWPF